MYRLTRWLHSFTFVLLLTACLRNKMYLNRAFKYAEFLFSDTFRSARTPDSPLSLYEGWSGRRADQFNTLSSPAAARDRLLPCRSFESRPGGLSFLRSLLLINDHPPNFCSQHNNNLNNLVKATFCDLCLPLTSWQYYLFTSRLIFTKDFVTLVSHQSKFSLVINCP